MGRYWKRGGTPISKPRQYFTRQTWHREMKQNFGFIDCRAARFIAIESHVNFSLIAYVAHGQIGRSQLKLEEYMRRKDLREINIELTKFGSVARLRARLHAALQTIAA